MKRRIINKLLAYALLSGIAGQVVAQEYSIAVPVDETTAADLAVIENFLTNAEDGAPISTTLRRIAMAAVGELSILADNRIDDTGNLTLDDGSIVNLIDEDIVSVKSSSSLTNVKLLFDYFITPSGITNFRPYCIIVELPSGSHVGTKIPGATVARGAPPLDDRPKPLICKIPSP